jgi:hypothetical protein
MPAEGLATELHSVLQDEAKTVFYLYRFSVFGLTSVGCIMHFNIKCLQQFLHRRSRVFVHEQSRTSASARSVQCRYEAAGARLLPHRGRADASSPSQQRPGVGGERWRRDHHRGWRPGGGRGGGGCVAGGATATRVLWG